MPKCHLFPLQVILLALVAVTIARPDYHTHSEEEEESVEHVGVLRDERVHDEDGRYNYDVETENGIVLSQGGSPTGEDNAVIKAGSYS